uniref:Putative secreted protein n=1 Tax=Ixodes ricinus TaxID=34613 RepID=A0A6B0U2A3_IXORI
MRSVTSTTSCFVDSVLRMSFFSVLFVSFVGGCQRVDGMNFNSYCEIVKSNHLWLLTALETQAHYAHISCFAIRC